MFELSLLLQFDSSAAVLREGLEGAVAEVEEEERVRVESEWHLVAGGASDAMDDSAGDAGVGRSSSPLDMTEEAELDTLPLEFRLDKERSENAAAEEAVDARDEVGAMEEPGRSAELESRRSLRDDEAAVAP